MSVNRRHPRCPGSSSHDPGSTNAIESANAHIRKGRPGPRALPERDPSPEERLHGADGAWTQTVKLPRSDRHGRACGLCRRLGEVSRCLGGVSTLEVGGAELAVRRVPETGPVPDGAALTVSCAKAWASDAYQRVCARAHQVHGAIGFTAEHDLHLYLEHAMSAAQAFGDTDLHLGRVADALGLPRQHPQPH
jgi:hypothetical protein